MNLKPELLRGIYAYGLECPSAIQRRSIVPILTGKHIKGSSGSHART